MENTGIQLIILVGAIFGGFFTFYKLFINHLEKKDKVIEQMTDKFIESNKRAYEVLERNQVALTGLSKRIEDMNNSSSAIVKILSDTQTVLDRAINVIEKHEHARK